MITVALAAAAASGSTACGGQTAGDGSGGSGGIGGGTNPPYVPCPPSAPAEGSKCGGGIGWSEDHCTYTPSSCGIAVTADCIDGKWSLTLEPDSCNPCPISEPADGSACPKVGLECEYPGKDMCESGRTSTCTDYGWFTTGWGTGGCNPPPPPVDQCPTTEPTAGEWCNVNPTLTCGYAALCCGAMYQCLGNQWVDVGPECNPPAPMCPTTAPTPGSPCTVDPCAPQPPACVYDQCAATGTQLSATCSAGSWQVGASPCSPPP